MRITEFKASLNSTWQDPVSKKNEIGNMIKPVFEVEHLGTFILLPDLAQAVWVFFFPHG